MAETCTVDILICSACMGKHAVFTPDQHAKFLADVKASLEEKRPDRIWNISPSGCFRFCPDKRITVSVARQMTMTRAATVESVVAEILSFKNI